jgi:hypothetical protein
MNPFSAMQEGASCTILMSDGHDTWTVLIADRLRAFLDGHIATAVTLADAARPFELAWMWHGQVLPPNRAIPPAA